MEASDPMEAPRCGAKRRDGRPCRGPVVKGRKRGRMHGGASTGPRTPEGLERTRRARWKHGGFSREAIEERRRANWETWEQAKVRLARELEREERWASRMVRQFRRMMRDIGL